MGDGFVAHRSLNARNVLRFGSFGQMQVLCDGGQVKEVATGYVCTADVVAQVLPVTVGLGCRGRHKQGQETPAGYRNPRLSGQLRGRT